MSTSSTPPASNGFSTQALELVPMAALGISVLALLFTVASFWWLYARKGKLKILPSTVFSGYLNQGGVSLRVQVLIHNNGARSQLVRILRLQGKDSRGLAYYLESQTFRRSIMPQKKDTEDFAHGFSVAGRATTSKFINFSSRTLPQLEPGAVAKFQVQGMLEDSADWRDLGEIEIHVGIMTGTYIGWSNNPGHWASNTREKGMEYQRELMDKVYAKTAPVPFEE